MEQPLPGTSIMVFFLFMLYFCNGVLSIIFISLINGCHQPCKSRIMEYVKKSICTFNSCLVQVASADSKFKNKQHSCTCVRTINQFVIQFTFTLKYLSLTSLKAAFKLYYKKMYHCHLRGGICTARGCHAKIRDSVTPPSPFFLLPVVALLESYRLFLPVIV